MTGTDRCTCGRPTGEREQPYQLPEWLSMVERSEYGDAPHLLSRQPFSWSPKGAEGASLNGDFTPTQLRELADAIEHYQRAD